VLKGAPAWRKTRTGCATLYYSSLFEARLLFQHANVTSWHAHRDPPRLRPAFTVWGPRPKSEVLSACTDVVKERLSLHRDRN
jgi:hypothetical protein